MLTLETAPYEMIVLTEMRSVQNEILCGPQEELQGPMEDLAACVPCPWCHSQVVQVRHCVACTYVE